MKLSKMALIFSMLTLSLSSYARALSHPNMFTCEGPGMSVTLKLEEGENGLVARFSASGPWGAPVKENSDAKTVSQEFNFDGMRFWITPAQGDWVFSITIPTIQISPENICNFNTSLRSTQVPNCSDEEMQQKEGVLFHSTDWPLSCVAQLIFF